MARSPEEIAEFNQQCFGCDPEEFKKSVEESITFHLSGPAMCIMSVLSDAQEEIDRGMAEAARQSINRAKYLIGEFFMKDQERGMI